MGRQVHRRKGKSSRKLKKKPCKTSDSFMGKEKDSENWVENLKFESLQPHSSTSDPQTKDDALGLSIVSWNVLAEAYCSRRSQRNLPNQYQKQVFDPQKRKDRILLVLQHLSSLTETKSVDVICLQEVDMTEIGKSLEELGYVGIESPRVLGGGAGGRTDACAIYVKEASWRLLHHDVVRLDDLARLNKMSKWEENSVSRLSNNTGIQQAFLRRNMGLICRLECTKTKRTVVVANAHLFWNPKFEYVKLCQAHYMLLRLKEFRLSASEPVAFCGDLNSRPNGITHSYLTSGKINAKLVAPWYTQSKLDDVSTSDDSLEQLSRDGAGSLYDADIVSAVDRLAIVDKTAPESNRKEIPQVRYLLDASLNKLCRWLRILGQDVALETDEEEKLRTSKSDMVIFKRCQDERRILVTASPRLVERRDCPATSYCIHPSVLSALETTMVHMLLVHGVVLEPAKFLGRCVVCNGNIVEVKDFGEKRRILVDYEAPPDLIDKGMAVYECDGCRQGYWWCDMPTSSASRVKTAASRLFELCVRAGVPIHGPNDGIFRHLDINKLRKKGWDAELPGSDLLKQRLVVVDWLKTESLACPIEVESAYAQKVPAGDAKDHSIVGESIPFTNVTHDFVGTLDYIFYDNSLLQVSDRLHVPSSFPELAGDKKNLRNAYLLPSDVWPSDHLAIGARLVFRSKQAREQTGNALISHSTKATSAFLLKYMFCMPTGTAVTNASSDDAALPKLQEEPPVVPQSAEPKHNPRCACGCVPAIPSLFEMAELRKKRRAALKKA